MIKKIILIFCLQSLIVTSQINNYNYFENYDTSQKKLITKHWVQYFKTDIHKQLDPTIDMFPIKFDSYGSLYPNQQLFKDFEDIDFNRTGIKDRNNQAYSLFDIFINEDEKRLSASIEDLKDKDDKDFYKKFLLAEESYANDSAFYTPWDKYHFDKTIINFNKCIAQKKAKLKTGTLKVVFFIHGFNVPYSLANVQAIEIINLLKQEKINTDNILLVPVFWPSSDDKFCSIENEEAFNTSNYKGLFNGGVNNGLNSMHYSNRAYFAATGVRKLINGISDTKVDILIFAHSLGSTVATSALINTFSKLDTHYGKMLDEDFETYFKRIKANNKMKYKEKVNYAILTELHTTPIPKKPIKVFLSAAAIPGYNTFIDQDVSTKQLYNFYVSVNTIDPILNKEVVPIFGRADRFGCTSLGCNFDDDAEFTKTSCFRGSDKFNWKTTCNISDHDILSYIKQPEYRAYVVEFFTKN